MPHICTLCSYRLEYTPTIVTRGTSDSIGERLKTRIIHISRQRRMRLPVLGLIVKVMFSGLLVIRVRDLISEVSSYRVRL